MSNKKIDYIKALILYNYIGYYIKLEETIKNIFMSEFENLDSQYKNRIYFYIGGLKSENTFVEYETYTLVREKKKFKAKLFSELTINQIIKMERKENKISKFNITINSIQTIKLDFTLYDCCIKLINMRNKMAHEFFNLTINNNKDTIEVLSNENLDKFKPEWLDDFSEYDKLDESMICILSNYIYMRKIVEKLEEN